MMLPPKLDLDPFDEDFLADPYAYHGTLRDAGPVVWLESIGVYAMARFDEVSAALREHGNFCSGRGVGLADFAHEEPFRPPSLLLEADPPLHDRTRAIMNRIVSPRALRDLRPHWEQQAARLVDRLLERETFDAVQDMSEVFPMMIFPDTIGLPEEGREHLLDYATIVFNGFGPDNAVAQRGIAGKESSIQWVADACQRKNLRPGGWGMALYEAADRGECSSEEAGRLVRSFLSAGVDTTVNGIGHLVLALARFPDQFALLRERPKLASRAFEESLRWDSTVQTFFRTTTRDVDVAGTIIPEGSKVLLFLASANRDPRKWDNPESFQIERKTSGHVGFGFGIHQCLGQMVARIEGEIIASELARKVKTLKLDGDPVRRLNNTLHALDSLPIKAEAV